MLFGPCNMAITEEQNIIKYLIYPAMQEKSVKWHIHRMH